MRKKFYGAILSFFIFTGIYSTQCLAQVTTDADNTATNQETCSSYDPIAAALDSLVNLNYVQRLNFASANDSKNNFQPYEVPSYSADIYAARMSKIPSPIPLTYNQQVREYIDLYAMRKRQLTERVMGLAQLYFPMYEQVLDQNDLPLEFKYLSIVESALNPMAVSRCGATGLWQFMLYTGKMYNLKVNSYVDERRDPYKSTVAACQYFKDMYEIYHDWLLVIAAYNCGSGNVNKAIARSGGKMNFWQISKYLPKETRGYVPAFIAVTYLMNYSAEHNLTAVAPVMTFHEADTVLVNNKMSLRDVASTIDVPYELMSYLNPVYKKGIIPNDEEAQVLRLPTNKMNAYLANVDKLAQSSEPILTADDNSDVNPLEYITKTVKKYITVKRGEHLAGIADRYNCSVSDIKRWNKMKSTRLVKGQRLLVYVETQQKVNKSATVKADSKSTEVTAQVTPATSDSTVQNTSDVNNNQKTVAQPISASTAKIIYHVVQPGDTLWNIANRYDGVTVQELKKMNRLTSNALMPGTKLKVKVG